MSRVGKKPITVPSGVTAAVDGQSVKIKGAKGELRFVVPDDVSVAMEKGAIKVGCDADMVIFKPESSLRVEAQMLYHKHKLTPYAGQVLRGVVEMTFLRGVKIYERGEFLTEATGALLMRGAA